MGGDVVVAAARLLKGRVVGLIWLDDYKELGPPSTDAEIEAFAAQFRADFPGMTNKVVRSLFRPNADPALVERVARDMAAAPATGRHDFHRVLFQVRARDSRRAGRAQTTRGRHQRR